MSFSVYLNSTNGTQVVAGQNNQIQYNFDWRNTPAHDGGYRVRMTFASEQQAVAILSFGVIRIQDLGIVDSYSPFTVFTATRSNHVMGLIRPSAPQNQGVNTVPSITMVGTTVIPNNAGTVGYTETTNTVVPSYNVNLNAIQTIDAKYEDNPPVYMQSKPVNNQFTVKITNHDGVLYTGLGATHYAMLLTFEPV